jgi:hypothetical protein
MMMKYLIFILAAALCGCTATKTVVTELDPATGKALKITETAESVVSTLTKSTANKTVIAWESGWAAYISASAATQEDPTPTVKLFAGKTDKGIISAHKDQKEWTNLAEVIKATKYDLEVSATGVKSGNSAAVK